MEAAGYNKCHRAPDSPLPPICSCITILTSSTGFADVAMARAEASPDTDTTNIKIVQLRDVDGHSFEEIAEILNGAEILQANLAVHTETPGLDFNATDVTGNGEGDDTGNVLPTTHDNTPTTGLVTDNSDSTPTTSTWTAQDCYARYVRAKNSGQVADEAEAEATANRPPSAPAGEEDEQTAESTDDSAEEPASTNEGDAGQSEVGGAERIPMETAWDDEAEDALAVAVEELRQDHWYRVALRVRDLTGRTYLPSECERRFLTSECFEQQYLEAHRAPRE